MSVITTDMISKKHLIGKIRIFDTGKYSNNQLACLICWENGKPIFYQVGIETMKKLIFQPLFQQVQEDDFIMECDAVVGENNVLSDIEISLIYDAYKPAI